MPAGILIPRHRAYHPHLRPADHGRLGSGSDRHCHRATPEVIREAAARGANLIITHEPTFFTHADGLAWLEGAE